MFALPVLLASAALQAPALAGSCAGVDMLEEMRESAPETYRAIRAEAERTAHDGAILWRVERPGRPPSHLLGTIHMTDTRVTTLSPRIEAALRDAELVALEVADVSTDATNTALQRAARLVMFTDGRRLDGVLTSGEIEQVRATLSAAGMPAEAATMFKPWVVTMILSVSECERRNVRDGRPVLDMKLAERARALGKRVTGLETIEGQLGAMATIPDEQQVGMLRASLKYADRVDDSMETLLQLYLRREMGAAWPFQLALAERAGVGAQSFAAFRQRILIDRNQRMHDAALPLFEQGGTLVAVGALHLIGEDGLVALLKQSGFRLTPVE